MKKRGYFVFFGSDLVILRYTGLHRFRDILEGGVVRMVREEEVDASSAAILNGFRLPSLRDCAGMTGWCF